MRLVVPELSLVVLVGTSGSGKSTFARTHFRPTEVLSSDACRGLVSDDENSLAATSDAFEVLHFIATRRLAAGRLTVVDATNVQPEARRPLVALARQYHCIPVAVVLDLPERLCEERNRQRPDRDFGPHVIRRQHQQLRRSLGGLRREGFRYVYVLTSAPEVAESVVEREPLHCNRNAERGPFDIIGDVHGCFDELVALLGRLGYAVTDAPLGAVDAAGDPVLSDLMGAPEALPGWSASHPEGRRAVFLGDLVDRGPNTPDVLRLVMGMVEAGTGLCVAGNHDVKLVRRLKGSAHVQVSHGLAESLAQLQAQPESFQERVVGFLDGLVSHYVLDDGKLVVAHAGLKEELQGRASGRVRDFALYGETTGETDEYGLPVRLDWAAEYRGRATVVYGHTAVPDSQWLNRTIDVDTGCVFGGRLTALRYPEGELVSVPAARVYYAPARPLQPAADTTPAASTVARTTSLTAQQAHDDLLDIADILGKRVIATRLRRNVTIDEAHATAALETMTRFTIDPKWLIYLPPTMSPPQTSRAPDRLEEPAEAFAYYAAEGVERVVCEEKHMGSRAVAIVCRDRDAARQRFGVTGEAAGVLYTRTGRPFFPTGALEQGLLDRLRAAMHTAGLWDRFHTDWICLDAELMPWSAKAQELLREQYAATGASARAALSEAVVALTALNDATNDATRPDAAPVDRPDARSLLARYAGRAAMIDRYVEAYRRYCWPVTSLADLKLAPFHILATEGALHVERDHLWHMETLASLCRTDPEVLLATPHREVDLASPDDLAMATSWWEGLTERGGEGMVVKPLHFISRGKRDLVQPAIKCRGREYLRLIYGPEYTAPEHLERLRARSLATKRSLALREFALGIEALGRFLRRAPLREVHECVFGVLALESEPIDPRL